MLRRHEAKPSSLEPALLDERDQWVTQPPKVPPAALTIPQASEYTGLSRSFIYSLFEADLLPRLKAGKRVLVLRSDLDAYLQSLREVAIK